MNTWNKIETEEQFYQAVTASEHHPQILFKDSTTCGISAHAKERLIQNFDLIDQKADFWYLDLLSYRPISNLIAHALQVTHQSPQIIVLKEKQVVYHTSHHAIDAAEIAKYL